MNIKSIKTHLLTAGLLAGLLGSFSSCKKEDGFVYNDPNTVTRPATVFLGLTSASTGTPAVPSALIRYTANATSQVTAAPLAITGLQTGETIIAIDYRPANKVLYGLSNQSRVYSFTLSATAAAATAIGVLTPALGATVAAFDFNPVADRLRIISTTGQNYRVDVSTTPMTIIPDGAINGGTTPAITGCAYTNSVAGAATTTLYSLDIASQRLYTQDANAGTLTQVGTLGGLAVPANLTGYSQTYVDNISAFRRTAAAGFDISASGVGLAVYANNASPAIPQGGITAANTAAGVLNNPSANVAAQAGTSTLFLVDLTTGRLTDLGVLPIPAAAGYGAASQIIGLAIVP